jgi:chromosome segregation ATPase
LLKGQEAEFVNSYKQHMFKVEEALRGYQRQIQDYQRKIEHYQNEGMLSSLLKKIQFLEDNEQKLLAHLGKKTKTITSLRGDLGTQQREILSLHARIKELMRGDLPLSPPKQQEPTFATEVRTQGRKSLKSSNSIDYQRSGSPQYQTISNPESSKAGGSELSELRRVNRQLDTLKRRHRQLSSVNSRIIGNASSI